MPVASIKLTQGATTDTAGRAVIGVVSQPVVASNGDNTGVVLWTWTIVGTPLGSSVVYGVSTSGAVSTYTFTPDVTGCYVLHLITSDQDGNLAEDYRTFGIYETSGRLIPSFRGTDASMNFAGQLLGWDPYLNAYLKQIDLLSAGTGVIPWKLPHRDVTTSTAWNPASDYELRLKTIAGATTLTFPASPTNGDRYSAVDIDGTAPGFVTVAGNGHNIANTDGVTAPASTFTWPALKYSSFEWEFTGTIWSIV